MLLYAVLGARAKPFNQRQIGEDQFDLAANSFRIPEKQTRVREHFAIFGSVLGNNAVSGSHGFDQRGVRAADLRRLNVRVSVRLELPVSGSINRARKPDPRITSTFEPLDIF